MRAAHRRAHRAIWHVLALLLPALFAAALALRWDGPAGDPPVRLAPPAAQP